MDRHLVEQREILVAVAAHVCRLDIVVGEMTQKRRLQPPLGVRLRVRRNGAKLGRYALAQAQHLLLTVQLRAHELEINEQPLLVLNNLRLLRHHAHVRSVAVALVIDDDRKLGGNHRLHGILRQRVVAVDVALHEVRQVKFRRRLHRQRHRVEIASHLKARIGVDVRQRTAKGVLRVLFGSSIFRRDEDNRRRARLLSAQRPPALHVQLTLKALQALRVHLHLMAAHHLARRHVRHVQPQLHLLHRTFLVAIEHRERAPEGLSCQRHRLIDLQGNRCTHRSLTLTLLHALYQLVRRRLPHLL